MGLVDMNNKTILVTGAAGFIGSNLVKRICEENPSAIVIGIDNMNDYYDVALKDFRLNELAKYPTFTFVKGNIADKVLITEVFEKYKPKTKQDEIDELSDTIHDVNEGLEELINNINKLTNMIRR